MLRVHLIYTRSEATHFGVPMRVRKVVRSYWSAATMRRRRQGGDKKVCSLCFIFYGRQDLQTVTSTRCVLFTAAVCDRNVFGPRREARIECKHVCRKCSASIEVLNYFAGGCS